MTEGQLRFGGLLEPACTGVFSMTRTFYHYFFTEWVDHHRVPTEPDELARFDVMSARPDYALFLSTGGTVRTHDLGVTTEQIWLGTQAVSREPLVLVVNAAHSTGEPLTRVTRKALLPPQMIEELLPRLFRVRLNGRDVEAQRRRWTAQLAPVYLVGVHDGASGHAINLVGLDRTASGIFYRESWPTGSFLQAGSNAAGLAAKPVPTDPGVFHVPVAQLLTVLRILLIPVATWAAATGDTRMASQTPAPVPAARDASPPPDAADRTRRFLEHCREHDLLTEQAIADVMTLYEQRVLFQRDRDGNDVLHHLHEMATTPRAPGVNRRALLCDVLRASVDPHLMTRR